MKLERERLKKEWTMLQQNIEHQKQVKDQHDQETTKMMQKIEQKNTKGMNYLLLKIL